MAYDIRKRFLKDSKYRDRTLTAEDRVSLSVQPGRNSGTFLKLRELPFNGRYESQIIQNRRTKFRCYSASAVNGLCRCFNHRLDSFPDFLSLHAYVLAQPSQI